MILFRLLLAIDIIAAGVLGFFFLWGLADGTVSSFNILLWMGLLGGTAAILGGGWALRRKGMTVGANLVLAILAAPAAAFGLFFLMLILLQPRWN